VHLCVYISMFLHLLLVLHVRVIVRSNVYVLPFDFYFECNLGGGTTDLGRVF